MGEGCVFPIETTFDSMARIGSIMQIKEASKDGDQPMRLDTNGDKILIILSKPDFATYKLLKSHEALSGPLSTSIVLPVLIEDLRVADSEGGEEDTRRWVRALARRVKQLELDKEPELFIRAQKLLELPIKRALVGAKQSEESR